MKIKSILRPVCVLGVSLLIQSCGGDGEDAAKNKKPPGNGDGNLSQELAGTIEGQAWQFKSGWADSSSNGEDVSITLSEIKNDRGCDLFSRYKEKDMRTAQATIPPKVGTYEFGGTTKSFVIFSIYASGNQTRNLGGPGTVTVDEVTRSRIRGRFSGSFGVTTSVSGAFSIKRCTRNTNPADDFVADTTLDPALVGHWTGQDSFVGEGSLWGVQFDANGNSNLRLNYNSTQLVLDGDQSWSTDSGVEPKRMIRTATDNRVDTNNLNRTGKREYCIYANVIAPNENRLKIYCKTNQFPGEFPESDRELTFDLTKG